MQNGFVKGLKESEMQNFNLLQLPEQYENV